MCPITQKQLAGENGGRVCRRLVMVLVESQHPARFKSYSPGCSVCLDPAGIIWCHSPTAQKHGSRNQAMEVGVAPPHDYTKERAHGRNFCFPSCDLGLVSKKGMPPSGNSHAPKELK